MIRKILLSLAVGFIATGAYAQFCPTQKGTVLKYNQITELPEHSEETIIQTVDSVFADGDRTGERIISKTVITGSLKTVPDQNIFVYYTPDNAQATTEYLLMSSDEFKTMIINEVREEIAANGQAVSSSDMEEIASAIRPSGKLALVLDPEAAPDTKIPNASLRVSISTMSFSFHISNGKVLGRENVAVPGGEFADCLKITYIMKQNNPVESLKFYVTEWYAPQVGCVKQEMKDKRGNMVSVMTLTSVERPQ